MSPAPNRFPSKRDWWLVVILAASGLLSLFAIVVILRSPDPLLTKVFFGLLMAVSMGLVFWLLATTYYEVTDTILFIRSGPFRYHVPLRDIISVTPSRNPLSSPALSLDRLLIRFDGKKGMILVSPADKSGFMNALLLRCPHLRRVGDQLASSAGQTTRRRT